MLVRLLLTAVAAAGIACAQIGGGDEGAMGGMGGGGGRGGGKGGGGDMGGGSTAQTRRLTRVELLFEKLKLNKEQKEAGGQHSFRRLGEGSPGARAAQ